jgi:tetratricopeptide (TPR) repeat protein
LAAAACALLVSGCRSEKDPLATTPQLALEHLQGTSLKSVYFNGGAVAGVFAAWPSWLKEEDRAVRSPRVRSMAQAALSPKLFRQLDRQEHFDAVLLCGDPIQFKPLIEHLVQSGDWALDWLDPFSLVYVRGSEESFSAGSISDVVRRWDAASQKMKAAALAGISEKLVAAHRKDAGLQMLERAHAASDDVAEVWVAEGNFRLARGEMEKAVSAAERALRIDKQNRAAKSVKAQGLYFSRHFEDAYLLSKELFDDSPEDPVMMFNHAKISHEVGAIQEEIGILRKLVKIALKEGRSASWFRVYLGQALGMTGKGTEAIAEFDLALGDVDLPEDQRQTAENYKKRIEKMLEPIRITK